ncbi:trypsin-like peptidase domain-containing protein [Chloracidobacterium aggregatum]|uniref:Trypsin-like peptidase domain-containing protein n=1 Tax=Chloracidobacterium sp. N TaxID=2821540 RepID=A0ABX8AY27_9BACT|nr:trypsin-like peptidase domain-containing protein [Chloracidobacterium aggregatum]QUV84020.1 trypsin-like peptidase domain-containing protein [Chloracidobacterium sp. 2]QUV87494.1 trypsin-like peptidase domain-containing protein [Chloracidobacterium sp. S]QUV93608.1 trypsin-like peptidase domain-containing protein [Chloracidobacterium sp. N]QUV96763.1 trypsin-like peptidase domain-containing protein [Chloracidobacterium sp. E]
MATRWQRIRWMGVGFVLAVAGVGLLWGWPPARWPVSRAMPNPTADALSLAFSRVAQQARTAVVNIRAAGPSLARGMGGATGSGFVIDREGHIVTNLHVVQQSTRLTVRLADGTQLPARLVAGDAETDLAVLKLIGRADIQPLAFGDSDALRVGEWVVAIGSPFGLDQTVTTGVISAKDRVTDRRNTLQQFLQTDAAINFGNSGGPLLNLAGEVIGVNTQIASRDGSYSGIGFALPSATVREVVRQLIERGQVSRSLLGVQVDRVTPQFARVYGLPNDHGALIQHVEEGGAAYAAGLRSGDVVVAYAGRPITSERDLIRELAATPGDTTVEVRYFREGKPTSVMLRTEERVSPAVRTMRPRFERRGGPSSDALPEEPETALRRLGLNVADASPLKLMQLGVKDLYAGQNGVLITEISPVGLAAESGLQEGMLITAVNRHTVRTVDEFLARLGTLRPGDDLVLAVSRPLGRTPQGERRAVTNFFSFTLP